jgi:hypothetical protein
LAILFVCFSYLAPKEFEIICLSNLFAMNVPDEGYGRKVLADFGYPVYVLWFSCSQRILDYLAFQSFDNKRT